MGRSLNTRSSVTSFIFVLLAVLYFVPVGIPFKTALPVTALFLFGAGACPWQLTLALVCSAAGDAFPSSSQLIPKIILFICSHVFYTAWFISIIRKQVLSEKKYRATVFAVFLSIFTGAVLAITPHAPTVVMKASGRN